MAVGTAGFSMQDILLEPYGGQILGLSVGQTTALTALLAAGGLTGFLLAAHVLGRGADPYRIAALGTLVGIVAFTAVIFAAPLDSPTLFRAGTVLIGLGGGLFSVGTLTETVSQASSAKDAVSQLPDLVQFALSHALLITVIIVGVVIWLERKAIKRAIDSGNLPTKSNFQGHRGLDAVTGKANFDISEWMLWSLLEAIHDRDFTLAVLCKSNVARKLLQSVARRDWPLRGAVWGIDASITTRTVDTHIKRLRDKLGPLGEYIETVRGIGYRLAQIRPLEAERV